METNEKLDLGIGTKETKSLEAKPVMILLVDIAEQKNKDQKVIGDKVVCTCKHPDREETIFISTVAYLKNKSVKTSGTWVNLDKDNLIAKQSALGGFLAFKECSTISELKDKVVETEQDENGYLCFKAY